MRKVVFWTLFFPTYIGTFLIGIIAVLAAMILSCHHVLHVLLMRFECWAYNVPPGAFANCPWRCTLWQEWKKKFQECGC